MKDLKILIVDDDQDFVNALTVVLQNEQYSVITAADRNEGMDRIMTDRPDLIILDVMMATWRDGFEMSRELKKDEACSSIPIIILTGLKEEVGIDFTVHPVNA